MPLCGRLFSEPKALFLFDLRPELRLSFGSRGLTGKKGSEAQGQRTTTAVNSKGSMVEAQASSQIYSL
ncbi:MAG: hypothetical protein JWQ42_2259 [Edaphobacter sp.]|jgi:hypothetical protein|nr:hypothetical protein [Edaphobacter sp.]